MLSSIVALDHNRGIRTMIFRYDPDSDMLYIELVNVASVESEEVVPGIVLDFDASGRAVGIEIEDASKLIDLARLEISALPITEMILTKVASMKT